MCHLYWIYIRLITAIYSIYIEASVRASFTGYTITCSILVILAVQAHQTLSNVPSMDKYVHAYYMWYVELSKPMQMLSYLIHNDLLT